MISLDVKSLDEHLLFYYSAFFDLNSCRNAGMGVGPIFWTAINDYAKRYDIFAYEFERFREYITTLDNKYLEIRNKEQK